MASSSPTGTSAIISLFMAEIVGQSIVLGIATITIVIALFKYALLQNAFQMYLNWRHAIQDTQGNSLRGPSFSWPDGQTVDKFLNGSAMSSRWRAYGPVYRIWTPFRPEVVINTPQDVKEFYSDAQSHAKAPSSNAGWLFSLVLGDCLGLISGPRWTRLRHIFDPFFSAKMSAGRLPALIQAGQSYVDKLHHGSGQTLTVNAVDGFNQFPFFLVADIIYGPMSKATKTEMWQLAEEHTNVFRHIVQGGIHRYEATKLLSTEAYKETVRFLRKWEQFNMNMYHQQQAEKIRTPLVQLLERADSGEVTKLEVLHTIDESLFANLDVTTHVLTWAIVLLADHPDIQLLIREEIRANANNVQLYISRKDTLLHYSILESLRVRPLLAFNIPESSPVDKLLGGFLIPKNTDVVVDVYTLHLCNPFWGEDPLQYRPQRFKDLSRSELRYNLATFGFGPRKCLGQHLAENMVKVIMVPLFTNFELRVRDGKSKEGQYAVDEGNWIALSQVQLGLRPLS